MYEIRQQEYVREQSADIPVAIGADIGGTNANIGIFDMQDQENPRLIFSLHGKSKQIQNFTEFMMQIMNILASKNLYPDKACFGVAGVISVDARSCKLTNASFIVDADELSVHTTLRSCYLANDFQIIGYGLNRISPDTIVAVNTGTPWPRANQIILGAGTGLGKSILHWHKHLNRYEPVVSEGGHADAAIQNQLEYELIRFMQQEEAIDHCNVSWEDVLSGNGIRRLFSFFCRRDAKELNGFEIAPHPDKIFQARTDNMCSAQTYDFFARFYARCAKNFCLDALALGGVYIAGGIAAKNLPLFREPMFIREFINCGKHKDLLSNVPIWVITDYNVSLYGAIVYLQLQETYIKGCFL